MAVTIASNIPASWADAPQVHISWSLGAPREWLYLLVAPQGGSRFVVPVPLGDGPDVFRDVAESGKHIVVGLGAHAHFIEAQTRKAVSVELDGYFGSLTPCGAHVLVASATSLGCYGWSGTERWHVSELGIDGVLVHKIREGVVLGEGEWDPPGGWQPFQVSLASGAQVHTSGAARRRAVVVLLGDPFIDLAPIAAAVGSKLGAVVVGSAALKRWISNPKCATSRESSDLVKRGEVLSDAVLARAIEGVSSGASRVVVAGLVQTPTRLIELERQFGRPVTIVRLCRPEEQIADDMAKWSWPKAKREAWDRASCNLAGVWPLYRDGDMLAEIALGHRSPDELADAIAAALASRPSVGPA